MKDNGKREHRPAANPDMARAMHGKRTSNAAGTHADKRTKRARTRSASIARDLKDGGAAGSR